jgi:hypothetical protein
MMAGIVAEIRKDTPQIRNRRITTITKFRYIHVQINFSQLRLEGKRRLPRWGKVSSPIVFPSLIHVELRQGYRLVRRDAVWSGSNLPTFCKNLTTLWQWGWQFLIATSVQNLSFTGITSPRLHDCPFFFTGVRTLYVWMKRDCVCVCVRARACVGGGAGSEVTKMLTDVG